MRKALFAVLTACLAACGSVGASAVTGGAATATAGWHAQHSGTSVTLRDVACLSTTHCFATGDSGTLLVTTDGGGLWRHQELPTSAPLFRITCVAPSTCYLIARPNMIVVTRNGGATWTVRTLPVPAGALTVPQSCPDGIVVQSGASQPENPPAGWELCGLGLLDVSCTSALTCYAVSTNAAGYDTTPPATAAAPPAAIWLTENGGKTWTSQPIPYGVGCNGDCGSTPYDYPLYWVSCLPGGPCLAGGNNVVGSHEGFASALLTTAGPGNAWHMAGCAHGDSCVEQPTDFAACPVSGTCYLVQTSNPFGSGTNVTVTNSKPSVQTSVPNNVYELDIACPAARTCYMAGLFGVITQTTNGQTFRVVRTPSKDTLYGITCPAVSVCYAVGTDGTILSMDHRL